MNTSTAMSVKTNLEFLALESAVPQPDVSGEFASPADGAKFMASLGIPQAPLSGPTDKRFGNPGKNPAINGDHWQDKATTDFAQIDAWAAKFPGCNFGSVAKLSPDGFYVLETDSAELSEKYAKETGREFEAQLVIESSAADRNHRWYAHSKVSLAELRNIGQESAAGFSVRCDDEQCVSPGSIHVTGKQYRVVRNSAPTVQPAEELRWLRDQKPKSAPGVAQSNGQKTLIPPGGHHDALLRELGTLIRHGYSKDSAYQGLLLWARENLQSPGHGEPLEEHIRKMVDSTDDWERGNPGVKCATNQNPFAESGTSPTPNAGDSTPVVYEPALITASHVVMEPITWLWKNRIPLGKLTLFAGNPDNGKSLSACSMAAICSTGRDFPDAVNTTPPSDVLMLLGEDDINDTATPRLSAAGADLRRIHFLSVRKSSGGVCEEQDLQLDVNLPIIESALNANKDIRLIVIDPISSYLGGVKMVDEQSSRLFVLSPLKRLAAAHNVSVVMVMHLNKKADLDAINRVGGAMAFVGVSRCSWLFTRDLASEDEAKVEGAEDDETFSMTRIKNNLARSRTGLSFKIKVAPVQLQDGREIFAPYVAWGGAVEKSADNALDNGRHCSGAGRPKGTNAKKQAAVRWLENALQAGEKSAKELIKEAHDAENISRSLLYEAADQLKVIKGSAWKLPPVSATTSEVAQPGEPAGPSQVPLSVGEEPF